MTLTIKVTPALIVYAWNFGSDGLTAGCADRMVERLGMQSSAIDFDVAARSLMDAAVDPSRWTESMNTLADYGNATGAVILPVKGKSSGIPHSESLGEALETFLKDGWYLRDERLRGLPLLAANKIFTDQDFASEAEMLRSDYYRGFLAKYDANWSAVVGFSDPTDESCLVFERGDKKGHFEKSEQADLVRFSEKLSDAAALARSLDYANAAGALDAYQMIGCASFLIDDLGRVQRYNERAECLLGDGLDLIRGSLRASHPPDNVALRKLIESRVKDPSSSAALHRNVVIHRPTKRPLVIRAITPTGAAKSIFCRASTILLVSDFEQQIVETPHDVLKSAFGLTPTEAQLVTKLEQDIPLTDAADQMRITSQTAKTHLKRILAKTQTSRQQDLLMLLRRRTASR